MHAWDVLNVVVIVSEDDLISRPDFQFIPPLLSILSLLWSKNHEDTHTPHRGILSSYNSKLKAQHISDAENPKYLYVKDSGYLGQTFWNI